MHNEVFSYEKTVFDANILSFVGTSSLILISLLNTGGLIWVSEWNSLQQPMASALLTVIFSDYMLSSRTAKITCDDDSFSPLDLRQFAMSQVW